MAEGDSGMTDPEQHVSIDLDRVVDSACFHLNEQVCHGEGLALVSGAHLRTVLEALTQSRAREGEMVAFLASPTAKDILAQAIDPYAWDGSTNGITAQRVESQLRASRVLAVLAKVAAREDQDHGG